MIDVAEFLLPGGLFGEAADFSAFGVPLLLPDDGPGFEDLGVPPEPIERRILGLGLPDPSFGFLDAEVPPSSSLRRKKNPT